MINIPSNDQEEKWKEIETHKIHKKEYHQTEKKTWFYFVLRFIEIFFTNR